MSPRPAGDRGTGAIGATLGLAAFLVGVLGVVQILFGLFARSTVTAVAADAVQRAASEIVEHDDALHRAERRIRSGLGRYGDAVAVEVEVVDLDGDRRPDTVRATVDAELPTFVPGDVASFRRVVSARIEEVHS